MKTPSRSVLIPPAALAVFLLAFVPFARAQEAVAPTTATANPAPETAAPAPETVAVSPEVSALPPAAVAPENAGTQVVGGFEPSPIEMPALTPYRWGPVDVSPRILYRYLYGDGIRAQAGRPSNTAIHTIAPGVVFGLGPHWTLDYAPTWTLYSNRAFSDRLNHLAALNGATSYEDWALRVSEVFASTSYPLVETGAQTSERTWNTALNATHSVGQRMLLDLGFGLNARFPDNFPDSREWTTTDWLHYKLSPDWDGAVGLGLGYVDVSPGPNMTFERPQVQISWQATQKIGFDLSGGMEIRQFNSSGAGDLKNPILSGSLHYQPDEATSLSIQIGRRVTTAFAANQVSETTYGSAAVTQRLLGEFFLTGNYAHQDAKYVSTVAGVVAGRDDTYDSVGLRLSTSFYRGGTVAAIYRYSRNTSNQTNFAFSSHQIGFEVAFRF